MKRSLFVSVCVAFFIFPADAISQRSLSTPSGKQRQAPRVTDALWINILPSTRPFPRGKPPQAYYFDLQSDGRFVYARGDESERMEVLRSGILSKKLVRRAFQIVAMPSVLKATDTDPGEPIFSDSDWVSIGLMTGKELKAPGGWAYQEELKDFPVEFRELVKELKSIGEQLPEALNIRMLLSAVVVDDQRAKAIGPDRFIALDEAGLDELPALRQALSMSRRMIPVEDSQLKKLGQLAQRMNAQVSYWGLYKIGGKEFYEVGKYYLRAPEKHNKRLERTRR
jgi:hypothetical protein